MNPEWNTETKFLYTFGTTTVIAIAVFVVMHYLTSADPTHLIGTNKWLETAITMSLIFAGIGLFDGSRMRNLPLQIPTLFMWSYFTYYFWPDGPGWLPTLAMVAIVVGIVGFFQWRRRRANRRST
jgi:hypothetical protein